MAATQVPPLVAVVKVCLLKVAIVYVVVGDVLLFSLLCVPSVLPSVCVCAMFPLRQDPPNSVSDWLNLRRHPALTNHHCHFHFYQQQAQVVALL